MTTPKAVGSPSPKDCWTILLGYSGYQTLSRRLRGTMPTNGTMWRLRTKFGSLPIIQLSVPFQSESGTEPACVPVATHPP